MWRLALLCEAMTLIRMRLSSLSLSTAQYWVCISTADAPGWRQQSDPPQMPTVGTQQSKHMVAHVSIHSAHLGFIWQPFNSSKCRLPRRELVGRVCTGLGVGKASPCLVTSTTRGCVMRANH